MNGGKEPDRDTPSSDIKKKGGRKKGHEQTGKGCILVDRQLK